MKFLITISILLVAATGFAQQTEEDKLVTTVKEFHQAMVNKNTVSLNQQTDKALSFGHSNGWVESKKDLISDLETGLISYQKITEDSITVSVNDNIANVRFKASVDATMKGNGVSIQLRVLEVWVKKSKRWILFARQAVKM